VAIRTTQMLMALMVCLLWADTHAQSDKPSEYHVKAAFLYNFANFVEWPESAFSDSTAPFIIGIIGKDPFGDALVQIVKGESVGRHKIEIRHWNSVEEIGHCHILYTMLGARQLLEAIFEKTTGSTVLTVGEAENFAAIGGILGFISDNNRVRFEVNIGAAERANLTISSKLQKVARRIIED